MVESAPSEPTAVQASFAAHLKAFHDGLSVEQQAILDQLLDLAESALREPGDVQGFGGGSIQKEQDSSSPPLFQRVFPDPVPQASTSQLLSIIQLVIPPR